MRHMHARLVEREEEEEEEEEERQGENDLLNIFTKAILCFIIQTH